ncbi:hypothetical protein C0214_02175 [Methylobacterium sp. DM1]|nr:hypothetical protein C0214_02175 [Methylobacterium sp. DM1]
MACRERRGARLRRLAAVGLLAVSAVPSRGEEATPRRVFVSGHSLVDRPLPDDLARISASLGRPLTWARRHASGSTIAQRACWGETPAIDETSGPGAADAPYDTLVVTEQHDLMGAVLWNDTVGELARLHDCFAARNPGLATWFYVPWISLDDKRDPANWLAYERAAAPLWRCVVAAANRRSAAARAGNRIRVIPAASALATLVESAADRPPPPGRRAGGAGEAAARLIEDQVHPTRLGAYALALLVEAATTGRPPRGAWAPEGVAPETAEALQIFSGDAAAAAAREPEPDSDACAKRLQVQATGLFWPYMERAMWRPQAGFVEARRELWSKALRWRWKMWREPDWTPFAPPPDGRG